MSDEEADYMSDAILASCSSQDIRPGLIKNRTAQREHDLLKKKTETDLKNKERNRPIKEIESEKRNEGLQTSINEQNKGFAMLQKMGYKSGNALGKTGTGRLEPVEISLKTNRTGLGRDTLMKEIAERKIEARKKYLEHLQSSTNVFEFRKRMTQKSQERDFERDLAKSQRACVKLDNEKNIELPVEKWFWPPNMDEDEESDEEEEQEIDEEEYEFSTCEKLEFVTRYLRETHLYCIWCGSVFDDEKDLQQNCPGPTRDDH